MSKLNVHSCEMSAVGMDHSTMYNKKQNVSTNIGKFVLCWKRRCPLQMAICCSCLFNKCVTNCPYYSSTVPSHV